MGRQRDITGLFKVSRAEDRLLAVRRLGREQTLAGLRWWAIKMNFKPGWAAHAYKEIWGKFPPWEADPQPIEPPAILEEWIYTRPRVKLGKRLIKAAGEARAFARNEADPKHYRVHVNDDEILVAPRVFS